MNRYTSTVAILVVLLAAFIPFQYTTQAQSLPKASTNTAEKEVGRVDPELGLKIISLVNADALSLTITMQPLFQNHSELPVVIVSDQRTNSIIARGPVSELKVLEALLIRLDESPTAERAK